MRCARWVFVGLALTPVGCASLIAGSGIDTDRLATREQVRSEFGFPDETGEEDGHQFDRFRTRRKIAEQHRSWSLGLAWPWTFGLIDLVGVPNEVSRLGRRVWDGQDLWFEYDAAGRVTRVRLDGEMPSFLRPPLEDIKSPPVPDPNPAADPG
jgi:hypothetical protein